MAAGRFAPSPSGNLHLGNLRTALAAWLFARSAGSRFVLRIEDLDRERSRAEHERGQIADLSEIGLDWDGETMRQSERGESYRDALSLLEAQGRIYPCWCTRAEIRAATVAPHGPLPEGAYPGTCRELSASERANRARSSGRPPSLRLDAQGETIRFGDRLRGEIEGTVDDFVLWRWDGTAAYNLAVVVDDAEQQIEQVVRGDDLLDSTPRQLLLYRLLHLPEPSHAHLPLVLAADGARLAKRHGAVTLSDRTALGEEPTDVLRWLAQSLGLRPGIDESSPDRTAAHLVDRFDPDLIPREPVIFGDGTDRVE